MAETYNLICDQCRVRVWVGQDSSSMRPGNLFLYGGGWAVPDGSDRAFSPAAKFLLDHQTHPLRFFSDNQMPFDVMADYVELDLKPAPAPPSRL